MEGVWHTEKGAPLLLFAIPDEEQRTNHFEIGIPNLASLILTHEMEGEIKGLNEFIGEHPPVKPVFFGFRIMVGLGLLMIAASWFGLYQLKRRNKLPPWLMRGFVLLTFSGWLATLAGWYVTEIGRQPYLVSGVLKVSDAATQIAPGNVGFSLILYLSVYVILLAAYLHTVFLMARRAVEIEEFEPNQQPVKTSLTHGENAYV